VPAFIIVVHQNPHFVRRELILFALQRRWPYLTSQPFDNYDIAWHPVAAIPVLIAHTFWATLCRASPKMYFDYLPRALFLIFSRPLALQPGRHLLISASGTLTVRPVQCTSVPTRLVRLTPIRHAHPRQNCNVGVCQTAEHSSSHCCTFQIR